MNEICKKITDRNMQILSKKIGITISTNTWSKINNNYKDLAYALACTNWMPTTEEQKAIQNYINSMS